MDTNNVAKKTHAQKLAEAKAWLGKKWVLHPEYTRKVYRKSHLIKEK